MRGELLHSSMENNIQIILPRVTWAVTLLFSMMNVNRSMYRYVDACSIQSQKLTFSRSHHYYVEPLNFVSARLMRVVIAVTLACCPHRVFGACSKYAKKRRNYGGGSVYSCATSFAVSALEKTMTSSIIPSKNHFEPK